MDVLWFPEKSRSLISQSKIRRSISISITPCSAAAWQPCGLWASPRSSRLSSCPSAASGYVCRIGNPPAHSCNAISLHHSQDNTEDFSTSVFVICSFHILWNLCFSQRASDQVLDAVLTLVCELYCVHLLVDYLSYNSSTSLFIHFPECCQYTYLCG